MPTPEIIARIRFLLLNVDTTTLSDADISTVYNIWYATYDPANTLILSYTLYDTVISLLERLMLMDNDGLSVEGVERKERVGSVSVETKTSDNYKSKWQKLMDWYITYPTEIDAGLNVIPIQRILVGGVSNKERHRINHDRDSHNGGYQVNAPYPQDIMRLSRTAGFFRPFW